MTVRKLTVLTATLALALTLGACGDKKDNATKDAPKDTASASASASPSDEPASTEPAGEIKYTTGDAKAAFNAFFAAISSGDGEVLCGFLDEGTLADAPEGFDCPNLMKMVFGESPDELKVFSGVTVKSVSTVGDKSCISLKDLKIDAAALAALMGSDGIDPSDDTPMCMTKASGHWVVAEDPTTN